jgi:hypothetical protein
MMGGFAALSSFVLILYHKFAAFSKLDKREICSCYENLQLLGI